MDHKEVENREQSRLEEFICPLMCNQEPHPSGQPNWVSDIQTRAAAQASDISHIRETVDEVKVLIKEQNSRIRRNETAIGRIQGVGTALAVVFSGLIGWIFKDGF